jgi:outer membrane protein assembly factor BamB
VKWTLDTGLAGKTIGATATHAFFLGHEGEPGRERHELVAVTADGRVAYRRALTTSTGVGALSPSPYVLLAWTAPNDGGTAERECGLSALDPTTGKTVWEKVVPFSGPEVASLMNCYPERILVSPRGAILIAERWVNGAYRLAVGFDPVTGAIRFQRTLDLDDIPPGSRPDGPLDPSMPLYVEWQKYPSRASTSGDGRNPVLVALNPETGHETTVAIFRADFAENEEIYVDFRLGIADYTWARNAILAVGAFRGHLVVDGLDADSGSSIETVCINIDPGYGSGGSLRDEKGNCRFGTERLRAYAPALFVARLPIGALR